MKHKRRLNTAIREGMTGAAETIPFVCECDTPGCFSAVWLVAGDFDAGRDDPAWALVACEHRPAANMKMAA